MRYNIYSKNMSNTARFTLGIAGKEPLFIIGVNPSTASEAKSDNTMNKVENFVSRNNYNGFVMLNLYPHRATLVSDLPGVSDKVLHTHNISEIVQAVGSIQNPIIWAAWGNSIDTRKYLAECLTDIVQAMSTYNPTWIKCGGLTASNHPRHPLMMGYANKFSDFDVNGYLVQMAAKKNKIK